MKQLTKDLLHYIAVNYLPREGGFASKLADAYLHADGRNQEIIEGAFAHLFVTAYRKWATTEGESK
jgi:isochorismate hydrolase